MKYQEKKAVPKAAHEKLRVKDPLLSHLLYHRGIRTADEALDFLNPDYNKHVHDPFLMKDMQKTVDRILVAIEKEEKVIVYSDYDADGIPGAVILHDFFNKIGFKNFEVYIPHRHDEGYGLNHEAVEQFVRDKVDLIITIDCGINDEPYIVRAKEAGIDVVVTDHHIPATEMKSAYAVVNPQQPDCEYPFKGLCGSGVIFKVIQAIIINLGVRPPSGGLTPLNPGWEKWLLDMVGLATLSDVVPLVDENRVFAHYGLMVLRKSKRPGVRALLRDAKINQTYLTEGDVVFMVTPRINAASRMGVPEDAFKLLSTTDEAEAQTLAKHLNKINDERKGMVAAIVKDVKKHIKETITREGQLPKVYVSGNPHWKPSLMGLVAGKIADEYDVPAFFWGRAGEEGSDLKGSCRSNGKVHMVDLMNAAGESFERYGGHKMAGGFSVSHKNIHTLQEDLIKAHEKLEKQQGEELQLSNPIAKLVDKDLSLADIHSATLGTIERLAPFGDANPQPTFVFKDVLPDSIRAFGKQKNHLELVFNTGMKDIKAIGFFMTPETFDLGDPKPITMVANIEMSYFMNRPELRLRIVDIV